MEGEKISIRNKTLLISFALVFFLLLGVASAADLSNVSSVESSDDNSEIVSSDITSENDLSFNDDVNELSQGAVSEKTGANNSKSGDVKVEDKKTSLKVVSPSTIIKGNHFQVKLSDDNGKGISKKVIKISFNGKTYNRTTNAQGIASLKLSNTSKYYTIKYSFSGDGYTSSKGSTKVLLIKNNQSTIKGSNYVAYKGFENVYTVTLTADGVKLANKKVRFNINGKNYYNTTNSKGKATLKINLPVGKYNIKYYFAGEKNIKSTSAKSTVTFKKGMPTIITRANSVKYYHKTEAPFKVKVLDARGNPVKGKVVFSIIGLKFTRNINSSGIANMNIKISQGSYKITYTFAKTSIYQKSSASSTLYVKTVNKCANNGYWLFGADMKNVNLDTLAKGGTKHIFLNFYALEAHGKTAVEKFISNAKAKGIKVHIWMQAFYSKGSWISPLNSDGSYKTSYFKSKINEAKEYANLKGVAGIHLDYLRFPGTAYKHSGGTEAINYFTKQFCSAIHKINSKLIVSAAVMPEVNSNKYYYGQDIPTISKYLDVIIPMVYKGNYNSGTSWIKSTTEKFIKQSNGAKIWTGLQTYRSDDDVTKLPASELLKDCQSASNGGATGVILFRWGISHLINFANI